jgi:DnaJ-class molecular chaperone
MPIVNSNGNYGNLIIKFNISFPQKKLANEEQNILLDKLKNLNILN